MEQMNKREEYLKTMEPNKITREPIYKNGCWTCKWALEDLTEQYICPKMKQHWKEYEQGIKE